MTIHEVIDVITVGYCLVPTARAVLMPRFMTGATMIGRAPVRVVRADFYNVLLNKRWVGLRRRVVQASVVNSSVDHGQRPFDAPWDAARVLEHAARTEAQLAVDGA